MSSATVDLLEQARRMLDQPGKGTVSVWARAAALLTRQELEEALADLWHARAPGVERLSMRTQLNCLPSYLGDPALASDAAFAWHALSRAIHHHPYELDPTADELRHLITMTARLTDVVRQAADARATLSARPLSDKSPRGAHPHQ